MLQFANLQLKFPNTSNGGFGQGAENEQARRVRSTELRCTNVIA
jgi:hypothetical protein